MDTPTTSGTAGPSNSRPPRRLTGEKARELFMTTLNDDDDSDWGSLYSNSDVEGDVELDLNNVDLDLDQSGSNNDTSDDEVRHRSRPTPPASVRPVQKRTINPKGKSRDAGKGKRPRMDVDLDPENEDARSNQDEDDHEGDEIDELGWRAALPGDKTKNEFLFRETESGSKVNLDETATPLQFLLEILDQGVIDELISGINRYARNILQTKNISPHSLYGKWEDIGRYEMYKFLAVIISIGMDPKPYVSDFWSTKPHKYTPWYSQIFRRKNFEILYHSMLHVCEPDATGSAKIEPFVNMLLRNFQKCFYPYREVAIDEMVIGFKGRFMHTQYNAAKPKKHHIKTFGLCDSATGYVHNALIYFGRNTAYDPDCDPDSQQAVKVFSTLMKSLVRSGHHIYADRYYSSLPVVNFLTEKRCNFTGTLNVQRRGFPQELKTIKLKHTESKWWYNENDDVLVVTWKDKKSRKPCIVISTKGEVGNVDVREGLRELTKPTVIHDYNHHMNGCDRADQMISYYSTHDRKTRRWWRKIFYWILEVAQVNAHILFTLNHSDSRKKMPYRDFKDSLVLELTKLAADITPEVLQLKPPCRGRQVIGNEIERYQGNVHLVDFSGLDKQCVFCRDKKIRKRTSYYCTGCSQKPHLCPKGCFYKYHKKSAS